MCVCVCVCTKHAYSGTIILSIIQLLITSSDDYQGNGDDGELASEREYKWILQVDGYIDQESLEIMKLGMRSELTQVDRDKAKRPSDLYRALECRYRYRDSSVCLARFIYALKRLGHGRYGYRAIEQLSEFSIRKPSTEFRPATYMSKKDLKKFKFLQNLVGVLVTLTEDNKIQQMLIKHFVEKHLNRINPRNINSLCSLFILLLEREVITADEPQALIEAMKEVGVALVSKRYNLQSHGMYEGL